MIIHAAKFAISTIIYELRRCLPLYADDRSNIYTAYAKALLAFSVSRNIPSVLRRKLWDRFARHLTMMISVERFFNAVNDVPHLSSDLTIWMEQTRNLLFVNRLREYQKYHFDFRPISDQEIAELGRSANLIVTEDGLDEASEAVLRGMKTLHVWHDHPQNQQSIRASLMNRDAAGRECVFTCLSQEYTGAYSVGEYTASAHADRVGDALATELSNDAYFSDTFPDIIHPELALLISDLCYRSIQSFEGIRLALADFDAETPVVITARDVDFAPELSRKGIPVLMQGRLFDLSVKESALTHHNASQSLPSLADQANWRKNCAKFDTRLMQALQVSKTKPTDDNVFVLCNRRSHSYNKAVERIEDALGKTYNFISMDCAVPEGLVKNVRGAARNALFSSLHSWRAQSDKSLMAYVQKLVDAAFLQLGDLDPFTQQGLKKRVLRVMEDNFGMLVAHGRLFGVMQRLLKQDPFGSSRQAILVPGRDPTVRIMSKAFTSYDIPTTDVQVLFVSDMPRYKAPQADVLAVIDSHAKAHFMQKYKYPESGISLMGSINLEEDVKLAKECDAEKIFKRHFDGPREAVISYALQPLPNEDIRQALDWCITALDDIPKTRLLIKLHPAQSKDIIDLCEAALLNRFGSGKPRRWCVIQAVPFHEVIAVSDLMLTHYSNVALTAAAMSIPVASLPVSGVRPIPTLADMHISRDVNSASELSLFVKEQLGNGAKDKPHYLQENPHMAKVQALDVLDKILAANTASPQRQQS